MLFLYNYLDRVIRKCLKYSAECVERELLSEVENIYYLMSKNTYRIEYRPSGWEIDLNNLKAIGKIVEIGIKPQYIIPDEGQRYLTGDQVIRYQYNPMLLKLIKYSGQLDLYFNIH